ncbi:DoxX family protein [Chishuiella sp.]|uniref:DoxX family protein n=1 Tax=Chishuiella sp. TaxID=1969467 RepID=UPI0028A6DA3D|nr:DoxX family protein [Chishuiella sp.]
MRKLIPTLRILICYLFIVLFVYAAFSKLIDFENFQIQLAQSPLLSAYAGFVSYAVIITELIIAFLLCQKRTQQIGLFASYGLMLAFTVYIYIILNYSDFIPCSCGGILEKLGWTEHLIFNLFFIVLAVIAILFDQNAFKNKVITSIILFIVISIFSTGSVIMLFIKSEAKITEQNPFIRKYLKDLVIRKKTYTLKNSTQYFIGSTNNKLYLADRLAPLSLAEIDLDNYQSRDIRIKIDRDDFPFRSVKVFISNPNFYLVDGTVPVIFKGNIANWEATVFSTDPTLYFSKAVGSSNNKLFVRKQDFTQKRNVIAQFDLNGLTKETHNDSLLDDQTNGIFDTDGIPLYDLQKNKFLYVYYYKNQYFVTDDNLKMDTSSKTIDTTRTTPLKVVSTNNKQKLLNPNSTVNRLATVDNGLLYINSTKKGQFEDKQVWKQASAIDIYDYEKQVYKGSFYLYNIKGQKANELMVIENKLYAIIGYQLVIYELNTQ